MPTRAALYLRVSTNEQDVTNQERALKAYAQAKGYVVVAIFADEGVSGAALDSERPGFGLMMKAAAARKFDVLLIFALDRLSRRGVGPVFTILSQLKTTGVGWESLNEGWASDAGPAGEIMLAILAWVSEQERRRISERTKASMASRRALGLPVGRAKGLKDSKPRKRRWAKRPRTGTRDLDSPPPGG